MVFENFVAKEELLGMISLNERNPGLDIYKAFKGHVDKIKLPLWKLISITTDGAPSMTGG